MDIKKLPFLSSSQRERTDAINRSAVFRAQLNIISMQLLANPDTSIQTSHGQPHPEQFDEGLLLIRAVLMP